MHKFLKRVSLSIIAVVMLLAFWLAPMAQASTQSKFINKLGGDVLKVAPKYNLYGSVMMAQAITESGWGSSSLSRMAKNYYGIKGSYKGQSVSMRTAEYSSNGTLYYTNARFRKYPNAKASMTDNAKVLKHGTAWNHNYYSGAWRSNARTFQQATSALSLRYSTNAAYGRQLNSIISSYHLHKRFDKKTKGAASVTTNKQATPKQTVTVQPRVVKGKTKKFAKVIYTKKYKKAKYAILTKTNHPLYNHVYNSRAGITNIKTKDLMGQVVTIRQKATKKATKTVWYYVTVNGKKGWIVASALSKPTTKAKAKKQAIKLAPATSADKSIKSDAVETTTTQQSDSSATNSQSASSDSATSSASSSDSSTSTAAASTSSSSN